MLLKAVFWDMDGTLIDSEPYWHAAEMQIARDSGGYWTEDLAWQSSGTPISDVARRMMAHGTPLPAEEIASRMIGDVAKREGERMPWTDGVQDVLRSLAQDRIPSVLVTTSPRNMAENLIRQAPADVFAGYVCGDDDIPKKPDPSPYLRAARIVGAGGADIARCVAIEDSMTGLKSAAASGATTLAQTGFIRTDTSSGPQFSSIDGYQGVTATTFDGYVRERLQLSGI